MLEDEPYDDLIKVSGSSDPKDVGSVIARAVVAGKRPKVRAIGAGAVNQAVKAFAIARSFTASRGIDLHMTPGFDDVEGKDGEPISALAFWPHIDQ